MHGTNGFPEEIMRKCIENGVSKVNVNKLVFGDAMVYVRENARDTTLTVLMEVSVVSAQRAMEHWMDVCGSTGKA